MKEIIKSLSKEFDLSIEETELLASTLLKRPRFEIYLRQDYDPVIDKSLRLKFALIKNGVPIEYITKQVQFLKYNLALYPGVFIPRLETEYFVEQICKLIEFKPQRICEIGTGCGAISIALSEFFKEAEIIATDICELALHNAQENILRYNLEDRIKLIKTDLFLPFKTGVFDLIICNPPYIPRQRINELPKSVRDFEPRRALDGGEGGTEFIKKLIDQGRFYLRYSINIALEIDEDEMEELNLYLKERCKDYFFLRDLFGRIRYLFIGRFIKCRM
uniref:peptide chain release factor N(5)-glutamine methyltransferase n=1 Tax=candidate division WOR-3 bacterium TaxID=2052148 RepID=A0A7V1EHA8_UNCW3